MKIITKTAMANFSSVKYFREQKKTNSKKEMKRLWNGISVGFASGSHPSRRI